MSYHVVLLVMCALLPCLGCDDESSITPPTRTPRNVRITYDGTGDFPTIQAAIEASMDGDTISLANGRFGGDGNRDLDPRAKQILIRSERDRPDLCIIDCDGTDTTPRRGFLFRSGETNSVRVEGITIEDGFGIGGGGAISCENGSSPTLRNMVFRANNNVAVNCESSAPIFVACTFVLNPFGGLLVSEAASPILDECTFVDNFASASGSAIISLSSTITMTDCLFLRNGASFSGGAILSSSLLAEPARIEGTSCVFLNNVAGSHGGAIEIDNSEFVFDNCTFAGNSCGQRGGALWVHSASNGTIANSVFYGNTANEGSAANAGSNSSVTIERTIIAQNGMSAPVVCDSLLGSPQVTLVCSDVHGNPAGDWTGCVADQQGIAGNLYADPLFCNALEGDFALQTGSPCLPPASACGAMGIQGTCGMSTLSNLALSKDEATASHMKNLYRD